MPVAPYYEGLSLPETLHYLRRVADSVQIPVMVYNLPHATGVDLGPDVIAGLAREVPNVRYVKNTSPDMGQAAQLIHQYGDLVSTFVGWDSLILSSLVSGSAGVMAGTANIVPAELVAVYDAVQAGDLDVAREAWARVYPLLDAALSMNYITAVKTALDAIGHSAGPTREPLLPLSSEESARITELARAIRPAPQNTRVA
jgi:4-hydroxy-tetrahydrodipicolinate synthase